MAGSVRFRAKMGNDDGKGDGLSGKPYPRWRNKDISGDDKDRPIREPESKNAQAGVDAQSVTAG